MATMPDSFFSWVVFLLNEYGATLLQGAPSERKSPFSWAL